ncbi:basic salivary proline-rich protein 3-like isoform X2 [Engraulis encrasicolus]|uniref:basic salivary proline-rich protein 3-like isoform X2 n=1 Tax=Engraulis encrasicolus TaxID=184585 RepID=UPI002FD04FAC
MTAEEAGEAALANGSPPAKRGRGRPKGKPNETNLNLLTGTIPRVPKVVQLFSAGSTPTKKSRPTGRPKKRPPGRPRKTPLSPEEVEIRERKNKHRKWKPLGRPRIHPVELAKKKKGKPGRPRKYPQSPSRASKPATVMRSPTTTTAEGSEVKRRPGRPLWLNKRRGTKLSHKKTHTTPRPVGAVPRKRGRPPGSGYLQKMQQQQDADVSSPPRKRGRPPGSKTPEVEKPKSGRKRGRPSGTFGKKRLAFEKSVEDGVEAELEEEQEVEAGQAAAEANGDTELASVEDDEAELGAGGGEEGGAVEAEAEAVEAEAVEAEAEAVQDEAVAEQAVAVEAVAVEAVTVEAVAVEATPAAGRKSRSKRKK